MCHGDVISQVKKTRSSWLNCVLRGDEAVYWVSIGQHWLVLSQYEVLIDVIGSAVGSVP